MKYAFRLVSPIIAVAILLAFSAVLHAEDKPVAATGKVSVTVLDKDGKAVDGATVRITAPRQPAPKADAKLADEAPKPAETPEKPAEKQPAERPARVPPVAEGKTDKDGKAILEAPAGEFNLAANLRGVGSARQKITVKAGETINVELKLAPRATPAPAPAK